MLTKNVLVCCWIAAIFVGLISLNIRADQTVEQVRSLPYLVSLTFDNLRLAYWISTDFSIANNDLENDFT